MSRLSFTICLLVHVAVVFGINLIENYIEDTEQTRLFEEPAIIDDHFLEHSSSPGTDRLLSRHPINDRLGVGSLHTPADDSLLDQSSLNTVNKAYEQIKLDVNRIQHPNVLVKDRDELNEFRSAVSDVLVNVVRVLAHHGSDIDFKHLQSSDLEYSQGWDRLASLTVYFFAKTSPEQCVSIFINLLDSKLGRLLNPHNYVEVWHEAAYVIMNNVFNRLQAGFGEDDINACHLRFVKSLGVGFLQPDVLEMVFFSWLPTTSSDIHDPLQFWLRLYTSIAVHFKSISFSEEQSLSLIVSDVSDMLREKESEFCLDVKYPSVRQSDQVLYLMELRDVLTRSFTDTDDLEFCII